MTFSPSRADCQKVVFRRQSHLIQERSMGIRKNQNTLTSAEWTKFIAAIDALHGAGVTPPAYRSFVSLHVDAMNPAHMNWNVHTMGPGMQGKNFLTWHRRFIKRFEERLQKVSPGITLPYWDSITDRSIPAALSAPALLTRWSITRNWDALQLAKAADLNAVQNYSGTFTGFQTLLEGAVHGGTHNAVGGDMAGSSSPADPLFWLHHANIDRLWAEWQVTHAGQDTGNPNEVLQPTPIFGVKVSKTRTTVSMGYRYA